MILLEIFNILFSNLPISKAKESQVAVDAFVLIAEICHNLNWKVDLDPISDAKL